MFDDLRDPHPPIPTTSARLAVQRRSAAIVARRRMLTGAGALAVTVLLVVGAVAFLDGPDSPTTQVAGLSQSATGVTSSPVTEPVSATGPLSASVTGDLVLPEGFTVTGCTVNGAGVAVTAGAFTVEGLTPGTVVEIVCRAESGNGAARAARQSVELVEGTNPVRLEL